MQGENVMSDNNSSKNQLWILAGTCITVIGTIFVALITKSSQTPAQIYTSPATPSAITSPFAFPDEQKSDFLTGVWESKDFPSGPATFYVRQVNSTVWWALSN